MARLCIVGYFVGWLAVALGHSSALAQLPLDVPMDRPPHVRSIHGGEDGQTGWAMRPTVTEIVFSADGSRLAVSYHRPARNRPGTDWAVWTAMFDLTTGEHTMLADTTGPLAFSPDGKWVALTHVVHQRAARQSENWRLAVHRFGDKDPPRSLQADAPAEHRPVALAFGPRGDYLKVLHDDGMLRHWPVNLLQEIGDDEPLPQPTALIRLAADLEIELRPDTPNLWSFPGRMRRTQGGRWSVFLGHTRIVLPGHDKRTGPVAMSWHYGERNRHISSVRTLVDVADEDAVKIFSMRWSNLLRVVGEPLAFLLRPSDVERNWPQQRIRSTHDGRLPVAYAPRAGLAAISTASGVELRGWRELPEERLFPGSTGGAVAFSPDESLLAVGDRNAIIRLWDIQRGQIVRSLRLDDQPAETFRVAAVQTSSVFGDPAANRESLAQQVRTAAHYGAWVVVLPEAAVTGYLSADLKQTWQVNNRPTSEGLTGREPHGVADTVPGPSIRYFAQVARETGVYLTVPLVEVDRRTGNYYNAVVLLGPDGSTLIHYRKHDLWSWAEQSWATPGNLGNPVIDTPLGRLGVLICFDIHKQSQVMNKLKVDTLLYSVAWVEEDGSDWFEQRLPAIAAEHGFHIVAANWTIDGDAPAWHGHGQSRVVHADGRILAARDRALRSDVVIAELPLPGNNDGD